MKELAGCNVEDLRYVGVPYPEREIPPCGFAGCHALLLVDIADSVTRLGPSAFEDCSSLTKLAIPPSVTEIGETAFVGCSSLSSLDIPNIGGCLFRLHLFDKFDCPRVCDMHKGLRLWRMQRFEEFDNSCQCDVYWKVCLCWLQLFDQVGHPQLSDRNRRARF